jgi:hypothetical protein
MNFLKSKGEEPFVFCLGNGTTIDRLLGGVDVKKLTEEGVINYLVQYSFLNHRVVILEELFDAPAEILEQLKDILSSGWLRQGNQQFQIKTELIICCTNRDRKSYVNGSASIKALTERFPLEHNVKWDQYNEITYGKLIENTLGKAYSNSFLNYTLGEYHKQGLTISPRIALKAATLLHDCGLTCLTYLGDLLEKKEILEECVKTYKFKEKFEKLINESQEQINKFKILQLKGSTNEFNQILEKLSNISFSLETMKNIPNDAIDVHKNTSDMIKLKIQEIKKTIDTLQINSVSTSLDIFEV